MDKKISTVSPALSVIVVTPTNYEVNRESMEFIKQQTAKQQIEIVLVGPSKHKMAAPREEFSDFHSFQIIEVGQFQTTGEAFAAGVQHAKAPIVAFLEEHVFMPTNWAEVIIKEHQKAYVAIGWGLKNANPESITSWVHLYGSWVHAIDPVKPGEYSILSGHNTAYKKEVLLDYGAKLATMFDYEYTLYLDLSKRGFQLYLTDQVASSHLFISNFWELMRFEFIGSRGFAHQRAKVGKWSLLKKGIYILGMPLVPWYRLLRVCKANYHSIHFLKLIPILIFPLLCFFHVGMLGELLGYLIDEPIKNKELKMEYELSRRSFMNQYDFEKFSG